MTSLKVRVVMYEIACCFVGAVFFLVSMGVFRKISNSKSEDLIAQQKLEVWRAELDKLMELNEKTNAQLEYVEKDNRSLRAELTRATENLDVHVNLINSQDVKLQQTLYGLDNAEMEIERLKASQLRGKDMILQLKCVNAETLIKLSATEDTSEQEKKTLERQLESALENLSSLQLKYDQLNFDLTILTEAKEIVVEENSNLKRKLDILDTKIRNLQNKLDSLHKESLSIEFNNLKANHLSLQDSFNSLFTVNEHLREDNKELIKKLQNIKKVNHKQEYQMKLDNEKIANLNRENKVLSENVELLSAKLVDFQQSSMDVKRKMKESLLNLHNVKHEEKRESTCVANQLLSS